MYRTLIILSLTLCAACSPSAEQPSPSAQAPALGGASAPAITPAEPHAVPEVPQHAWGTYSTQDALTRIEGDMRCHWSEGRGFDHDYTVPGIQRTDASYCTATTVQNIRRTGLFITSRGSEVWVPTPTKPHAYTYGDGGVFVAADMAPAEDEVHVVRWEQGAREPTWRHSISPEDAWQIDLSLDGGVLVVSWGSIGSRERKMLDARTGEVLAQEVLPERVRGVVEDFEQAFDRSAREGRLCGSNSGERHLQVSACDTLASLGRAPRLSKVKSRGVAYERLDDGTVIVLDDARGEITWLEEASKRTLGSWRSRNGSSGFWH